MKIKHIIQLGIFLFVFFWHVTLTFPGKNDDQPGQESYQELEVLPYNLNKQFLLNKNIGHVDQQFKQFMKRWHIKGGALAMVKNGKLVLNKGYGYANTESKEKVQPDHLFRIASISKLITAVTILKMNEEAKLDLDEHVFGPEGILNDSVFLDIRDERVKHITIRHLLRHSSGFGTWRGDPMFMPLVVSRIMDVEPPPDLETIIEYVLENRYLGFHPGQRSFYSNLGYSVLGKVIAEVSDTTYEHCVRKEVFEPLDITGIKMGRNLANERYKNEVTYYTFNEGKGVSYFDGDVTVPKPYGCNDIETLGAAGGWVASAPALMKLVVAIDGYGNKPDILSEKSREMMTYSDNKRDPMGWRGTNDQGLWWRSGTFSGTSAMLVRTPDSLSWVALFNTDTWKGPSFSSVVYEKMNNVIKDIPQWPSHDLFSYSHPHYLLTMHRESVWPN